MRFLLPLLAGLVIAGAAKADYVFTCTGKNTALHFVIYEDATGPGGGQIYLEGIQAANLSAHWRDARWLVATVNGNAAPAELQFDTIDGQVFIAINGNSRHICPARVTR